MLGHLAYQPTELHVVELDHLAALHVDQAIVALSISPFVARLAAAEVAALGRAFLDLTLDFKQVNVLMCWGLVDSYSWLQGRTPRADGAPKRPTPYDAQLQPKPLRAAIASALRGAKKRGA